MAIFQLAFHKSATHPLQAWFSKTAGKTTKTLHAYKPYNYTLFQTEFTMKNTDKQQEPAEKQKDKPTVHPDKAESQSAEKKPKAATTEEEEEENPFGGISSRNLKKNLGCGG